MILADLRVLCERATPGPWRIRKFYHSHFAGSPACLAECGAGWTPRRVWRDPTSTYPDVDTHEMEQGSSFEEMLGPDGVILFGVGQDYDDYGTGPSDDNAAFIAAARTWLPVMIEALDACDHLICPKDYHTIGCVCPCPECSRRQAALARLAETR